MRIPVDSTFDHKDPYKTLGVTAGAAPADIRKAYLELAKRNHPNLFATDPEKYRSSTVLMQDINAAYELLSDRVRRESWDRQHSVTPRPAPRRTREQSKHYDSELVHLVIRKYNEYVSSLRTAAEREEAIRRIRQFQASRDGSAYIRQLVARHYREVMDLLRLDRQISMYDDGLVEIMFLYPGALEVAPSSVFITYAYLLHRENRGKFPVGLDAKRPPARGPAGSVVRLRLPGPRGDSTSTRSKPAKGLGPRVWEWLLAKPGPRRR